MNWIYILLRTFPFWGIPTAGALIFSGIRGRKKLAVLLGIVLMSGAIAFLFFQGHSRAVPLAHELLNQRAPASAE